MLGIRSSFLQASFNYERMQACGFTWAMLPALEKVYGDDKEKLSAAMTDNLEFINTHPNLVGFLMGLMMSLEEGGGTRDAIKGLKLALFGPIAGIGDAIFWFTILPIVAGISCSFASQGSIIGDTRIEGKSQFLASSAISGDIQTQCLEVECGAVLQGNLQVQASCSA